MEDPHPPSLVGLAADTAGKLLAGASQQLTKVRRSPKPLHPEGDVVTGVLTRAGSAGSGVPWLESPGTDDVVVRLSRAVGLPHAVPDIHGLAVRIPVADDGPDDGPDHDADRHADLLLASTGLGRLSRFVLTASREISGRPMTTLLPYRSPRGPLLIAAQPLPVESLGDPTDPLRFELSWARRLGSWVRFGDLTLVGTSGPDPEISFDPVLNPLPDLEFYPWVRRLREPAYRAARRTSHRT